MNRRGFGFIKLEKNKHISPNLNIRKNIELGVDGDISRWEGCYEKGWEKLITPESFAHPAKFSRVLIEKIYDYSIKQGWVKKGDWVFDPFAGIALGGVHAMVRGLNWVGIELEQFFFDLANGCECSGITEDEYNEYNGEKDSKKMAYVNRHWCPRCIFELESKKTKIKGSHHYLGNLELWNQKMKGWFDLVGSAKIIKGDSRRLKDVIEKADDVLGGYGHTPRNLANLSEGKFEMVVSSPPYAEMIGAKQENINERDRRHNLKRGRNPESPGAGNLRSYTTDPFLGQLGAMKEGSFDLCISSPPYESDSGHPSLGSVNKDKWGKEGKDIVRRRNLNPRYGNSNQLGSDDTFWSASKEIIRQCYDLLKPNGHAIWVTKDYVKSKKRIPFSDQWLTLCESVGFKLVCRHYAMLARECGYGKVKEKKSFFRHLVELKGAPYIDWEDILCLVKE